MQSKRPLCTVPWWLVLACVLASVPARANGLVVEVHTRERAADATALFAPIYDELEQRGYSGRAALARHYERRVSRPVTASGEVREDFVAAVELGHRAAIAGRFDEAVVTLTPLVAEALAHSIAIARSPRLREAVLKALLGLALSHQRGGDLAAAKTAVLEMMRTYPDTAVARAAYGPEANAFYEDVRRAVGRGTRGSLRLEVGENVVVFLNERFVSLGGGVRRELIPGVYRVFAQLSKTQTSRVHYIEVKAGQETAVTIDAAFEDALHTSADWTGLVFASGPERDERDTAFASRFAADAGATSAVILMLDSAKGRTTVTGTLLDVARARELRRASVLVSPGSDERLRALAVFLAGGEPADGLVVEMDTDGPSEAETPARSPRHRWMLWTGIGGIVLGVAAGGGLALSYRGEAQDAGAELARVCGVSCAPADVRALGATQTQANHHATLALAAGSAVAVTGVVLLVMYGLDRRDSSSDSIPPVAIAPVAGGAIGFYATTF